MYEIGMGKRAITGKQRFMDFAVERHQIYVDRFINKKPPPWTTDSLFLKYSFTNVFRELDKTTIWFRKYVRDPLRDKPEVFLATILFRWFNRITTGEALFSQGCFFNTGYDGAGFAYVYGKATVADLKAAIVAYCGDGPYVTGSYIITSPKGMKKLDGVLWCVENIRINPGRNYSLNYVVNDLLLNPGVRTLEEVWTWLNRFHHMGPFMAYEVVSDLRHTAMLDQAPDIMTWANPGPGCKRGLCRLLGIPFNTGLRKAEMVRHMQNLLDCINEGKTRWLPQWPRWEMREVEHTLCEFDKYERLRLGQGTTRGRR